MKLLNDYYLIRYDRLDSKKKHMKFIREFIYFLQKSAHGINDVDVSFIKSQLFNMTWHTTAGSNEFITIEKQLKSNPLLIEYLVRTFYWDFIMFGFAFPNI